MCQGVICMNLRQQMEQHEDRYLSPWAARSAASQGRGTVEEECNMRPAFQRDRDRILYCKAFRRLKHKTQVFLAPAGDHYRTRLTHTLEVAQIARSMARALRLNEDLTEAIALGHDLGHTPFGHAGEDTLNQLLPQGFQHWRQSLRVVDHLEGDGQGLNLTFEVRMGIFGHSKGRKHFLDMPDHISHLSMEGQLVRAADIMAYVAHDTDDALRGGVIKSHDLPEPVSRVLGLRLSQQIGSMVRNLIEQTAAADDGAIHMSPHISQAIILFRDFLYQRVYENMDVHYDFIKASKVVRELFLELMENDQFFTAQTGLLPSVEDRRQMAVDYVAGMTDGYALLSYNNHFMPHPWARF